MTVRIPMGGGGGGEHRAQLRLGASVTSMKSGRFVAHDNDRTIENLLEP